jgi:hypothetical protein
MPSTSLRFLHTADWHLGQPYRTVADRDLADRLRQARLDAVGRVLAEAQRSGAAFVLAAGDQFDAGMPDPRWLDGLLERVAAAPGVAVHMIPGNHDPYLPGSVYDRSGFKARPANLHFHDRAEAVALPEWGATLFPCPCLSRFGGNPLDWIPARRPDDGWRIALAHGSLPVPGETDGRNFPVPADAPNRYDLDYVALGDWHTATPDPAARPRERMYYSGAPEVGGWDETGAGFALRVELAPGSEPRVEKIATGHFTWTELAPELHGPGDLDRLGDELGRLASPSRIVRARPVGSLAAVDRDRLRALVAERSEQFAALEVDLDRLGFAAEADEPATADPLIRAAYRRLARLAAEPTDGPPRDMPPALPPLDAEVAALALARFRALLP